MRSQNKNPKTAERLSSTKRGQGSRSTDADSEFLQKIAKNLGNTGIQDELNQRSAQRDQLLAFICHRLNNVQQVQNLEVSEMQNEDQWFREIARGTTGFALPQPTRWHECANSFKAAAQALCQGNLGRGKQLLEQALEQEQAAYDSLPKQIENQLEQKERSGDNAPLAHGTINTSAVCPSIRLPQEIKIADRILNVRDVMEDVAPLRVFRPLNWWENPAEEEEEDQKQDSTQEEEEEEEEETLQNTPAKMDTTNKDQS